MAVEQPPPGPPHPPRDEGLRRMLLYTFIALGLALMLALLGATLAIRWFDRP